MLLQMASDRPVLLGGRVGKGKQMHVTGMGPEANDTHLELRLSGRLDCLKGSASEETDVV